MIDVSCVGTDCSRPCQSWRRFQRRIAIITSSLPGASMCMYISIEIKSPCLRSAEQHINRGKSIARLTSTAIMHRYRSRAAAVLWILARPPTWQTQDAHEEPSPVPSTSIRYHNDLLPTKQ